MIPEFILLAITISATDGHEIQRVPKGQPFDTLEACSAEQIKTGIQHPADGTIVVYDCAVDLKGMLGRENRG
jgi:hypothetical protein